MNLRILVAVATCVATLVSFQVRAAEPKAELAGVTFLVGHWTSDDGKIADTGGRSRGSSDITLDANGGALLRRDHTDLFNRSGKPTGSFDQLMMIYPEGGTLHADYSDGEHVIHYTKADVIAGKSVIFTSAAQAGAPTFRLTYELNAPSSLTIIFAMARPGQTDFKPIASGTARKS